MPREYIEELHQTLPQKARSHLSSSGVVRKYVAANGKRRVCGGPGLKGTQVYTATFGKTAAALHASRTMKTHLKPAARRLVAAGLPAVTPNLLEDLDPWDDAGLSPVRRFIERRRCRP